jgi:hypothetical protein
LQAGHPTGIAGQLLRSRDRCAGRKNGHRPGADIDADHRRTADDDVGTLDLTGEAHVPTPSLA